MAKNDQQESYERLLSANHARMIDFVRFAETKNAALLTFCSVWIGAIITLLRSPDELLFGYNYAFITALPLLTISAAISLKSLLPRLLDHIHKREKDHLNLLYFGDIDRIGIEEYPSVVLSAYFPDTDQSSTPRYLHDLGMQTAIQASIAHRKFQMFRWAGSLVLLAFLCMMGPPAVYIICFAIGSTASAEAPP